MLKLKWNQIDIGDVFQDEGGFKFRVTEKTGDRLIGEHVDIDGKLKPAVWFKFDLIEKVNSGEVEYFPVIKISIALDSGFLAISRSDWENDLELAKEDVEKLKRFIDNNLMHVSSMMDTI